jgi:flagellar biosynthesis/type III secretory pathway protein FliH
MREGMQQGMQQGIQEGMQQGIREGLLAGIELGLELKFGSAGLRLLPEIYKIEDVDVLRAIHEGLKTVTELGELQAIYRPNVAEKSGSTNE